MQPILKSSDYSGILRIISALNKSISENGFHINIPDKVFMDFEKELNFFFRDSPKCKRSYFSVNTDKDFFGIMVSPSYDLDYTLSVDDIRDIRCTSEYRLDLDSRLFSLGLTDHEILTLLIYDIYNTVTVETITSITVALDAVSCGRGTMNLSKRIHKYHAMEMLFEYAIQDYIYRSKSIFSKNEFDTVQTPDIIKAYGLDRAFISAVRKVSKTPNIHKYLPNDALVLNWAFQTLELYDPKSTSAYLVETLESIRDYTGSEMIKNMIYNIIKKLVITKNEYEEDRMKSLKEGSLFNKIKKNGIKSLENDVFEYEMRVKNIEDENSAILLMRQINSRIGIILDYLENEKLSDTERERWEALYGRYDRLRIKMTNKPIYSRKMYGLFVDYNALMDPNNQNAMTMNTYY